MESKLIEIRDEGTHIPVLATAITKDSGYPARRAGYIGKRYIILTNLTDCQSQDDPFKWLNGRTLRVVHQYLEKEWDKVEHDGVVDARFILGETPYPVSSDRKD